MQPPLRKPQSTLGLRKKASRLFGRRETPTHDEPVPALPPASPAWPPISRPLPSRLQIPELPRAAASTFRTDNPPRTPPFELLSPTAFCFNITEPVGRAQDLSPSASSQSSHPQEPLLPMCYSPQGSARATAAQPRRHRNTPSIQSAPEAMRIQPIEHPRERFMAVFEVALAYLLQNEGNVFVNDPFDHGGPTRFGVTLAVLSKYLGRQAAISDVQNIDSQTVASIYRINYWTPIRGDKIQSQQVATALLDMAALTGPAAAVKMMQTAVKAQADGVMGPVTLGLINQSPAQSVLVAFSHQACGYFTAIVLRDPTQNKFLSGWQLRAHRMLGAGNAI